MTRFYARWTAGALACTVSASLLLAACGGDDEQATEQRIARERAEAALIAKQEERIRQLERERRADRRPATRTTVTVTPPPSQSAPAAAAPSADDDWPGSPGYTTILASVGSRAEARRIQSEATERGLDAGVLYSSNYRSLRAGYWVVFSGSSSSKQDADRRTARAKSLGYSSAYPRFVSG